MERSERNLEKSIMDMMQVEGCNDLRDPVLGEQSQIIYCS
jgi:hypothetical protein